MVSSKEDHHAARLALLDYGLDLSNIGEGECPILPELTLNRTGLPS